jgi:hypothetical protein
MIIFSILKYSIRNILRFVALVFGAVFIVMANTGGQVLELVTRSEYDAADFVKYGKTSGTSTRKFESEDDM